jgi:uncharacterized protein (DUF433 family)
MVWQVLEMVAKGMPWDEIVWQCHGSITHEAIAEAIRLANKALADQAREQRLELIPA